jgi:hypothetical protein
MFRDSLAFLFFFFFQKNANVRDSRVVVYIAEYFIQIDGLVVRIRAAEMPGASN